MKKITNQSYVSHAGRMNNGGGKFRRIALFPLMLLMLLLLPTRMVAQTANGNTSNQAYAEFDNSSGTFTFKCGPKPAGAYDLNEGEKLPKWFAQRDKIKTVVFDASFANARPTSCYYWFCFCYNLTTIEGIEYLNTEKVTNMKDMFYRCSALTSLDLSNFNTAEVTDMTEMFCSCSALTTIFVSDKFVTGQVTSSVDMFSGCDKLIGAIKYDGKNTNNKDYANYKTGYFAPEGGFPDYAVFDGGTGTLTFRSGPSTSKPEGAYDLNVGTSRPGWSSQRKNIKTVVFDASFANARLTNCYAWFYGCNNLTTIEGIEYLNTENVTNMDGMFDNCCALTSLNLTSFNTAKVESMSGMFYNCCALTSLDLSNFNTANVTDMSKMFEGCSALTSLNLSNFNTAGVKDMYCMFCVCSALTSLDLSNFNTAEVTDMTEMFDGCSALTTIFVSDKFVTDHVTNSSNMFSGCDKLIGAIKYDGKNTNNKDYANYETGYFALEGRFPGYAVFDKGTGTLTFRSGPSTSKPEGAYDLNVGTSLPGWFAQREEIKTVVFDASFANARPTSCHCWFYFCTNLTTIEGIEYLNTEKVTNMSGMFHNCSDLISLDVTHFNTENVTSMIGMFDGCAGLISLDVTNFNTANVTDMSNMFNNCSALTSLNLTNFNTAGVLDMRNMFDGCSALTTIYVSDKFVTEEGLEGSDMFSGCVNLKGAIDKYEGSKTDHTYANYKTGYFSKLVGKNGDEKIGAAGETLTADNLVLDDDKDFVAYEPFTATAATYNRTINANTTWATLCLPFEVSLAGQNFRAFKLLSADEGTGTVELEEIETSIAAGTPVIIKMNEGATQLDFSVENTAIAKDIQTAATADGNYQLQGLYAQKEFSKDADNNCYIVKGNQLMNPAKLLEKTKVTKVVSKPFRAYMVDNTSTPAAGAKMFSIGFNDNTTAIDNLNTIANDKAVYYDIQGLRLNAPQKGINIVKRGNKTMKVIIK